jgi:dipeptidyl aminopeptidase/acylaminoacyl peptidase
VKRSWLIVAGVSVASFLAALTVASAIFCNATLRVARLAKDLRAPVDPGVIWDTVTVQARDGAVLEGWFVHAGGNPGKRCVAVLHGINDSRVGAAGFAPMFLAEGYSVLLPDSRAHGRSGGQFVTYGLLEKYDVFDWVRIFRKAIIDFS